MHRCSPRDDEGGAGAEPDLTPLLLLSGRAAIEADDAAGLRAWLEGLDEDGVAAALCDRDASGLTLLHHAAQQEHVACARALLAAGGDAAAMLSQRDADGCAPLWHAIGSCAVAAACVRELLETDALQSDQLFNAAGAHAVHCAAQAKEHLDAATLRTLGALTHAGADARIDAEVKEAGARTSGESERKQKAARVEARFEAVKLEMAERGDLRHVYALSSEAHAAQRSAMQAAYAEAAKARAEAGGAEAVGEWPEEKYGAIASRLKASNGYAARDFKLIVGAALFSLIVEGCWLPSLDIIVVKTHGREGNGFCVLVYAPATLSSQTPTLL